ncbi:hypothetical protein [Streptomyces ipomoeae]|uniref:hypothetical protein n=1 Tax=Streptomyces ipomoeae TaxID=103232 RepID=UPI0011461BAC|nr:hypothetical protein [Streptomyces ipomoeae]TQE33165.1 hypothetical protein Sipo7851_21985 [Streptomyces ipomoeae]
MTTSPDAPPRTFGDMSIDELLASAANEAVALQHFVESHDKNDPMYDVIVRAYGSSIGARVTVAKAKLEAGQQ